MNYKEALIEFCNELIAIENKEWKPFQCFRSEEQFEKDEIRHEMASEIADLARNILRQNGIKV
jgi:hypothetical protein